MRTGAFQLAFPLKRVTFGDAALGGGEFGFCVFPGFEEAVQFVSVHGYPVLEEVHEGLDVGDLGLEAVGVGAADIAQKGLGKVGEGVIAGGNLDLHAAGQVAGYVGGVFAGRGFHKGELRDQATHRDGGFHKEGVVGDYGNLVLEKLGGDGRSFGVATHEDGDIGPLPGRSGRHRHRWGR